MDRRFLSALVALVAVAIVAVLWRIDTRAARPAESAVTMADVQAAPRAPSLGASELTTAATSAPTLPPGAAPSGAGAGAGSDAEEGPALATRNAKDRTESVEPPMLAVRGRVVDRWADVAGAEVMVLRWALELGPFPKTVVATRTGIHGDFEVRAPARDEARFGGELVLRIRSPDHAEFQLPISLGRDVGTITLERCGAITGRLLFDPGREIESWRVVTRRAGRMEAYMEAMEFGSPQPSSADVSADGSFELRGVPPGRHDLYLTGKDWVGPQLALWRAVAVEEESGAIDLGTFALHGRIAVTPLTVRAADDSFVREVGFFHVPREGWRAGAHSRHALRDGLVRLMHSAPTADVVLQLRGHLDEPVSLAGSPVDVSMRQGVRIRVRVVGWERLADRERYQVSWSVAGFEAARFGARLDETGSFDLDVTTLGRLDLHLAKDGRWNAAVLGTFDITPAADGKQFLVELPEDL